MDRVFIEQVKQAQAQIKREKQALAEERIRQQNIASQELFDVFIYYLALFAVALGLVSVLVPALRTGAGVVAAFCVIVKLADISVKAGVQF